jgi:rfaE bifunctional protein nucleotidyltransferase chain/domain
MNPAMPQPRPVTAGDKIKKLAEITALTSAARESGRTVVMAHGVFDLLHMGHVRHIEEARSFGDMLVVSVTPDRFVNKGPGRPVFGEMMRAEMLAALGSVDLVTINEGPTAEPAIEAIRPNVYVKGPDYVDAASDVTGKINDERDAVERHQGRIQFTDDVTFSSSALINRYFSPFEPHVRDFVDSMREDNAQQDLLQLIETVADMKVLVVGDAIIDEYRYVTPMGRAPKENLVATLYQNHEIFAGGVMATANHVAGICRQVDVLTVFGDHDEFADLARAKAKPNVTVNSLQRKDAPTTRKVRYVDATQMRKLFETYYMNDVPVPDEIEAELNKRVADTAADYDLVIVNDFGHGMIKPSTIELLSDKARFLAVNTQANSANFGFNMISKYPRADYVCIDALEARLATGQKHSSVEHLMSHYLVPMMPNTRIVVTQGRDGCLAYAKDQPITQVPALADKVFDTMGAGDAFLAITSPLVAAGGAMRNVAFLGNIAGALKVGIIGHRQSVDKVSMIKAVIAMLK